MRRFLLFFGFLSLGNFGAKGQGLFSPEQIISSSLTGEDARYIHVADINGDGNLDVIAAFGNTVAWYENNGNTEFSEPIQIANAVVQTSSHFAYGSDIDNDGDMDVVSTGHGHRKVQWYANDGLGDFGGQNSIAAGTMYRPTMEAAVADLDNDGNVDVIAKGDNMIAWHKNNGNGNFGDPIIIQGGPNNIWDSYQQGLYISDLDNDGDVDFIALLDENIGWYENDGEGSFTKKIISLNHENILSIYGSDVDNDGDVDIFCSFSNPALLVWYENDGANNFNEEHFISSSTLSSHHANSIYSTDLDNDGDMDVIAALGFSNKLVWYENGGYGNFSSEKIISTNTERIEFVCSYDIDKDGDMDVFSASSNDGKIAWYENILDETEIRMRAFYDLNENGTYEENEPFFLNQQILLNPTDNAVFSSLEGYAYFFVKNGQYQLTYQPNSLWELTTTPETYHITVTNDTELPTYYFGFKPTRILPRVEPHLNSSPTRCSTESTYWLTYSNTGTTMTNGTITLETDELMGFLSSNPEPDAIEGRNLIWHFEDLHPSFENKIELQFQMPDFNSIGEILETQASLQLFNENEELVYSKSTDYNSEVLCSYDPNDKLVRSNLLGQSESAYIEDTILYTIRFQNTGNDVAFNIRIEDILDKRLDWTTFHPITASHDYRTELNRETGLVTFYFDNILLPDSTSNEPESHGFVLFGIASLAELEDKTEVENTASIFFDFNPPIVTNTTSTVLIELDDVSIGDTLVVNERKYVVNVYPNPFSDYTTIEVEGLPEGGYQLEVMDILGRKVHELPLESLSREIGKGKAKLERGELESGVYLWRILEEENLGVIGGGKILIK